jgi:hypothetical protein
MLQKPPAGRSLEIGGYKTAAGQKLKARKCLRLLTRPEVAQLN